ncbi:hypothetical protein SETIT_8G083700v2 [Setaria italica]|uniref:NB-ARC domain-containing protein n=1 Tax=Setaria italica TaxID=4555 RepID=A0A368S5L2_SETIT|nr:hypothetical protein SETIT_8G083700v2 [Setaria italica]
MDLVSGAVGSVIGKLGELLHEEYKLQKGLPEQIQSLKHELESAKTVLSKVGEVLPEQLDPQVRLWASEVREASYDMEDILDTCLVSIIDVDAPAENKNGLLKRLLKNIADLFNKSKDRHTIAGAIDDMKKRIQEVADRRDRFSVEVALPALATKPDPRLSDMHKEAAQLIGIEKTKAELTAMLLPDLKRKEKKRKTMLLPTPHGNGDSDVSGSGSSSSKMKIVSVVRVGGLGKTNLAKAVYDELQSQYDCGAFLSVGRKPDLAQVLSNILYLLNKNEYTTIHNVKDQSLLIGELRKFLQNKRYFIVINDVWDVTTWNKIKSALVNNDTGSRVITTTRNRDVASREEVYELRTLSPNHSEKLFRTRLFGVNDSEKYGGIPLAIITMASLLVGKSREDWFVVCNSPGFYRGKGNQQVDDTEWILSLSYYDLPSYLRTCLLYLSGEEYFNQLVNRSMIQEVESDDMGLSHYDVWGCRVHDMMLDLIRDLSYKENFLVCLHGDTFNGTCAPDGLFLRKVTSLEYLRIRIDNLDEESHRQFIKDVGNHSEVRVLHIYVGRWKGIVQSDLVHSLGNLHKLEHLELASYNGKAAMREWGRVVFPRHLRHLGLGSIPFRQLPSWISPAHLPILRYLSLHVDHMDHSSLRNLANITAVDGFFKKLRYCWLYGWMVQLVLNEDSTGVSFSIWNGMGAIAFGSKIKDEYNRSIAPLSVMPNLQVLHFDVPVRALYKGASADDVEKVEAKLRNAVQLHPNRLIIKLQQRNEHNMMAQSTDQDHKEVKLGLLGGRS